MAFPAPAAVCGESVSGSSPEAGPLSSTASSGPKAWRASSSSSSSVGSTAAIQAAAKLDDHDFRVPDELWVRTIYEFACSYHHSVINRDHLLQALTPLYRGRMASFVLENQGADGETIERKLEGLTAEFERQKPGLDQNWTRKK